MNLFKTGDFKCFKKSLWVKQIQFDSYNQCKMIKSEIPNGIFGMHWFGYGK